MRTWAHLLSRRCRMSFLRVIAISAAIAIPTLGAADPVKMSTSAICHCPGGAYYARTKNFRPFPSIQACLEAGGRHPKKGQGACDLSSSAPALSQPTANAVIVSAGNGSYDRDLFGGWADDDGDCQNTRHELLAELSTGPIRYSGDGCRVERGRWNDPYSGQIHLDAAALDVDHLVPLAYAWAHGADAWAEEKRRRFANDLVNLFAVEASANRQKGASGPLEWLPEDAGFHCQYLLRFTRVSESYGLTFPPQEANAIYGLVREKCEN